MREKLEAAIEANPDDVDAYLVYADWLQGQGDPRGELIVLQHQGKQAEAAQLIERAELLGAFGNVEPKKSYRKRFIALEWKLGFITSAHLGWETSRAMSRKDAVESFVQFLALPSARVLQKLTIGPVPTSDFMSFDSWIEALAAGGRPQTLRELVVGDIGHWDISGTSAGPFDGVLRAFPRLRSLTIHAGEITLGALEHAELRELAVQTGGIGDALDDLAGAKLPRLEKLEIWLGTPNYGGSTDPEDIMPFLEAELFPSVRHLGLMNAAYTDEIVRRLALSTILPQLRTLDLSMGTLSDAGVRDMVAAKDRFAHLDELNLDDNALTSASKPLVHRLAKVVHFGDHDPDRVEEEDIAERYTSVGE